MENEASKDRIDTEEMSSCSSPGANQKLANSTGSLSSDPEKKESEKAFEFNVDATEKFDDKIKEEKTDDEDFNVIEPSDLEEAKKNEASDAKNDDNEEIEDLSQPEGE